MINDKQNVAHPFIPVSEPSITQLEIDYVTDAISSGWVSSLGKYIDLFESRFAEYCGTKYAIATSNGTTGLHLALAAYGIKEGDSVIVPDLTFVATANAVKYVGAEVIFADIDKETLCMDPDVLESLIHPGVKAIIPVHLYGHPANMPAILEIAKRHNLLVIEDAAEAHGAEIMGKKVGSFGNCGVFSFYGNKIITAGEGGMITTNDPDFYEKARYLRDHAMTKGNRYWHDQVGFNFRMTNLQAALGVAQLERIDELKARREATFKRYSEYLSDIPGVQLNRTASWARNAYWMVCLEIEGFTEEKRADFMARLREQGVDSRPYFYPVSDMPMYQKAETPVAHKTYPTGLNMPSYYNLTDSDIKRICEVIRRVLEQE